MAYAGDEFVVVLPGVAREAALAKARGHPDRDPRDRATSPRPGRPVRLAASFGVATYPDDAHDLESLLALGDQALFSVKDTRPRRHRDAHRTASDGAVSVGGLFGRAEVQ